MDLALDLHTADRQSVAPARRSRMSSLKAALSSGLWRAISSARCRVEGLTGLQHAKMDHIYSDLTTDAPWFPYAFFQQGWGNLSASMLIREEVGETRASTPLADVSIGWEVRRKSAAVVDQVGYFDSPRYQSLLAPEALTCHFQITTPTSWDIDFSERSETSPQTDRPFVVILPGTGEFGFGARRREIALRLAAQGIGSVLIEGAYYGCRKPVDQPRSKLRTVSDLLTLGGATIVESRVLLCWLRERGHTNLAVSGVSMGGLHAGMIASVTPFPVSVVSTGLYCVGWPFGHVSPFFVLLFYAQ